MLFAQVIIHTQRRAQQSDNIKSKKNSNVRRTRDWSYIRVRQSNDDMWPHPARPQSMPPVDRPRHPSLSDLRPSMPRTRSCPNMRALVFDELQQLNQLSDPQSPQSAPRLGPPHMPYSNSNFLELPHSAAWHENWNSSPGRRPFRETWEPDEWENDLDDVPRYAPSSVSKLAVCSAQLEDTMATGVSTPKNRLDGFQNFMAKSAKQL